MKKISTQNPFNHPSLVVKLKDNFLCSELGPESIILNLDRGVYFGVSNLAELIWRKLTQSGVKGLSIQSLQNEIYEDFEVDREALTKDLADFLQDLDQAGFVQVLNCPSP